VTVISGFSADSIILSRFCLIWLNNFSLRKNENTCPRRKVAWEILRMLIQVSGFRWCDCLQLIWFFCLP